MKEGKEGREGKKCDSRWENKDSKIIKWGCYDTEIPGSAVNAGLCVFRLPTSLIRLPVSKWRLLPSQRLIFTLTYSNVGMFLFLPHGLTSHELCASAVLGWKSLGLAHSAELYKCTDSNHVFWSMEIVGEAGIDRLKLKLKIWSDVTFLFSEMLLAWQSWGSSVWPFLF